jgi:butyrate kinase
MKTMEKNRPAILVINPGSTSTKIAVYRGASKVLAGQVHHTSEELAAFKRIADQHEFRQGVILGFLEENGFDLQTLSAVVGRGGMLAPMDSGTYQVTDEMMDYLANNPTEHASNLGAILAGEVASIAGCPAFIVDPVVVDEMDDVARVTGIPEIRRKSIFHALNQKAVARQAARRLGRTYEETRLVVAHLGGGISVAAHRGGKVVDVNNALNGDGPMGPERAGSLPAWQLVELVLSGRYGREELKKLVTGRGGLVAHLNTNDVRDVRRRIAGDDRYADLVYRAMAYQAAKEIGSMAVALEGRIDAIVLTGGMAHDRAFIDLLRKRVSFLSEVMVFPGEDEMASLAMGAFRVLNGEETEKVWRVPWKRTSAIS